MAREKSNRNLVSVFDSKDKKQGPLNTADHFEPSEKQIYRFMTYGALLESMEPRSRSKKEEEMIVKEVPVIFGTRKQKYVDYIITKIILASQFLLIKFESNLLDPDEALKVASRVNIKKEFLKKPLFRPEEFEYVGEHNNQLIFKKKSWDPKEGLDIELPSGHVILLTDVKKNNEEHAEYIVKYLLKSGEPFPYEDCRVGFPEESYNLLELIGISFIQAYLGNDNVYTESVCLSDWYMEYPKEELIFGTPGQ